MPGRTTRITFGFTLAWVSGIIGALIQNHIYRTSPCGYHASKCKLGKTDLTVWVQVPIFVLGAMSGRSSTIVSRSHELNLLLQSVSVKLQHTRLHMHALRKVCVPL